MKVSTLPETFHYLTTSIEDVMESYRGVDARTERYPIPIVFNPVHRGPPQFLDPSTLGDLVQQALDEIDEETEETDVDQRTLPDKADKADKSDKSEKSEEIIEFDDVPSWTTLTDYYQDLPTYLIDDDLMGLVCREDYESYRYTLFSRDGVFLYNTLPNDVSLVDLDHRTRSTKNPEGFYMTNALHPFPQVISLRGDHDGSDEVYLE